jgi:hypothetical protein
MSAGDFSGHGGVQLFDGMRRRQQGEAKCRSQPASYPVRPSMTRERPRRAERLSRPLAAGGKGIRRRGFASHELPPVHPRSTAFDGATPWLDSPWVRLLSSRLRFFCGSPQSPYGIFNKILGGGERQACERVSAILLSLRGRACTYSKPTGDGREVHYPSTATVERRLGHSAKRRASSPSPSRSHRPRSLGVSVPPQCEAFPRPPVKGRIISCESGGRLGLEFLPFGPIAVRFQARFLHCNVGANQFPFHRVKGFVRHRLNPLASGNSRDAPRRSFTLA